MEICSHVNCLLSRKSLTFETPCGTICVFLIPEGILWLTLIATRRLSVDELQNSAVAGRGKTRDRIVRTNSANPGKHLPIRMKELAYVAPEEIISSRHSRSAPYTSIALDHPLPLIWVVPFGPSASCAGRVN